jgi:D-sedoheptulose 7-phosphate isomerase
MGEAKVTADVEQMVVGSLRESSQLSRALLENHTLIETVAQVGEEIARALSLGRKIFFFGNGGSASDAEHLAAEFVGRFERERRPLPAIALSGNTSILTATGNDYAYDSVFSRHLEALGSAGDVAIAISTSGKSQNVIKAVQKGKELRLITIGLTGQHGNQLAEIVDHCIRIPSNRTSRIQEVHILIGHILCEIVEGKLLNTN